MIELNQNFFAIESKILLHKLNYSQLITLIKHMLLKNYTFIAPINSNELFVNLIFVT